jgi:hypothetical protein
MINTENMKKKKLIYDFNGVKLISIPDPGCGCKGCFFNKFENCSSPREKHGIDRCSLSHSIFIVINDRKKKSTPEQLADKIIAEMTEAGLSYDNMLKVIRLARKKYELFKQEEENRNN